MSGVSLASVSSERHDAHLHDAHDFEPVDLGVFGELLAQRGHGALEVLALARVLALDVRVESRLSRLSNA